MHEPHGAPAKPLAADPRLSPEAVSHLVCGPLVRRASAGWRASFAVSLGALLVGVLAVAYMLATGLGVWGINRNVAWAFDITNFVFWIGIGHAGTLISAVLLLLRQPWRTAVNRTAELATLIAIVCAALFPLIHIGRPWLFFWLLPYPNDRGPLWINFASPLTWDVFAITTYFVVSLLFCYLGLLPDLATARDRTSGRRRGLYAALSLGWNGSGRQWALHRRASVLLAGLATPLVVSVHSIVSLDFAVATVPGWHSTLFPPYFVAGAIFSGIAAVLMLLIAVRRAFGLQALITLSHFDALCKLLLATSLMLAFAYAIETVTPLYSARASDRLAALVRTDGPLARAWAAAVALNVAIPQLLWWRAVRRSVAAILVIAVAALIGMWLERFVIVVAALERDYLPATWVDYRPTALEVATLVGSIGLFCTLFLLFCRWLPLVSMSEIKAVQAHGDSPEP